MDKKRFLRSCQDFKNAILAYDGDDPLQCRYDFIKWIEGNGKENGAELYLETIDETLNAFKTDPRYSQDVRFVELILMHINMQTDKLQIFEIVSQQKLGTKCSILYEAWAKEYLRSSNFLEAEKVLKKGLENAAEPLCLLEEARRNIYLEFGKQVLSGKWDCSTSGIHCKCKKTVVSDPLPPKIMSKPVVNWEWQPLKPGEKDVFTTPICVPDPPDPNKIAYYPKDQVYVGDSEFQIEEIRARLYLIKYEVEPMDVGGTPAKILDLPGTSILANQFPNTTGDVTQSFTVTTKAALNLVHEMWNSSSPGVGLGAQYDKVSAKPEPFKAPEPPHSKIPIFSDEGGAFSVYKDNSAMMEQENAGQAIRTTVRKSSSKAGLSVQKAPPHQEEVERATVKQLIFDNCPTPVGSNLPEDVLAQKLDPDQTPKPSVPAAPFMQVPQDWVDSDLTCNTKVFNNFLLHASTPNMKLKMGQGGRNDNAATSSEADKENLNVVACQVKKVDAPLHQKEKTLVQDVAGVFGNLNLGDPIDPFSPNLHELLLKRIDFPNHLKGTDIEGGYYISNSMVPTLSKPTKLGNGMYTISSESVKGAYAKVVRATCGVRTVALKVEKPPCYWEYYICKEILRRVTPGNVAYFMDIQNVFIFKNASIFEMEWAKYGTLLNVINKYKINTGRQLDIDIGIYFSIELMKIIHTLHTECNIIHADIKPDNFVVRALPSVDNPVPSIQLIDFGRSIDMKLMPKGYTFNQRVTTDGFECNEMKENKPWTFQTDLYGLAGTIHCVLVGDYMKVHQKRNVWVLQKNLPRGLSKQIWDPIFNQLLNVESCDKMPDLRNMIMTLENLFKTFDSYHTKQIFKSFSNILNGHADTPRCN